MSSQQRRERWQNDERYYCAVCNAWMGSDRQSIMLHENGKKHRENVEKALIEKRVKKQREEKAQKFLSDSLRQMEEAALAGTGTAPKTPHAYNQATRRMRQPPATPVYSATYRSHQQYPTGMRVVSNNEYGLPPVHQAFHVEPAAQQNAPESQLQQEKIDWQAKNVKCEEISDSKRKIPDDNGDEEDKKEMKSKRAKTSIAPGEGYYSYDDLEHGNELTEKKEDQSPREQMTTYLEGEVFHGLLEEDVPVQIWTGPSSSSAERRDRRNSGHWKNALVAAVVSRRPKSSEFQEDLQIPMIHVSYLASPKDTEETIEKNVSLDRIRIKMGADEKVPDNLEEARLLAMGGEEIHVTKNDRSYDTKTTNQQDINEATGLSGWSTVTIKKTTHRQQHREERERYAEMKNEAAQKREIEKKRLIEKKLEEARVSNADDSALGAYDVWGKMDYKGVDISKEVHCSIEDTAKRLAPLQSVSGRNGGSSTVASGGKVSFKKRVKKKGNKAARRTTSADDD